MNTRQYSDSLALAASEILAASGADVTQPVAILPLAKQLQQRTGCHITAAKSHISRAVRRARHAMSDDEIAAVVLAGRAWGGHRPGAGRPRTTEDTTKSAQPVEPMQRAKRI